MVKPISDQNGRIRILTLLDYYLPGFRAGGPLRTISNMVSALGEFEWLIVTRDRDLGSPVPYDDVIPGKWHSKCGAQVMYLGPSSLRPSTLRDVLSSVDYDVLYVNSLFSPWFTVLPLLLMRLSLVPRRPVIIAPRGELSLGALKLRRFKKRIFLAVARMVGMYKRATWQASSEHERLEIRKRFGDVDVVIAPDVPAQPHATHPRRSPKFAGRLNCVFVARISPIKNLDGLLHILSTASGDIALKIYGPIEDPGYWAKCQRLIGALPPNVRATYCGELPHDAVGGACREADLMCLLTHGENYGHVIHEALMHGCPVLISDRTPWRGLEDAGVGWDVPLDAVHRFRQILARCVSMDEEEHRAIAARARAYAVGVAGDAVVVEENRLMVLHALLSRGTDKST